MKTPTAQAMTTRRSSGEPRGYFALGVEGISKSGNLGNLMRSAHAFGASFFFTVNDAIDMREVEWADTSASSSHMPFYRYQKAADLNLPKGCALVGVELLDTASPLPSFRHPLRAAYVLGPEKGELSKEMIARCDHIVQIPMKFCVNVGVAGAILMYDRMISLGQFAERPVRAGGVKN
jgi:tRNA G18 (ribose-2'-O)-methylase SpoU